MRDKMSRKWNFIYLKVLHNHPEHLEMVFPERKIKSFKNCLKTGDDVNVSEGVFLKLNAIKDDGVFLKLGKNGTFTSTYSPCDCNAPA